MHCCALVHCERVLLLNRCFVRVIYLQIKTNRGENSQATARMHRKQQTQHKYTQIYTHNTHKYNTHNSHKYNTHNSPMHMHTHMHMQYSHAHVCCCFDTVAFCSECRAPDRRLLSMGVVQMDADPANGPDGAAAAACAGAVACLAAGCMLQWPTVQAAHPAQGQVHAPQCAP